MQRRGFVHLQRLLKHHRVFRRNAVYGHGSQQADTALEPAPRNDVRRFRSCLTASGGDYTLIARVGTQIGGFASIADEASDDCA